MCSSSEATPCEVDSLSETQLCPASVLSLQMRTADAQQPSASAVTKHVMIGCPMWDLGSNYKLFVKAPMNNDLTVLHVARLAQVRTETPSESGGESEGIELSPLKAASKDNMDNVKDAELKSVPSVASISAARQTNALDSMSLSEGQQGD